MKEFSPEYGIELAEYADIQIQLVSWRKNLRPDLSDDISTYTKEISESVKRGWCYELDLYAKHPLPNSQELQVGESLEFCTKVLKEWGINCLYFFQTENKC